MYTDREAFFVTSCLLSVKKGHDHYCNNNDNIANNLHTSKGDTNNIAGIIDSNEQY